MPPILTGTSYVKMRYVKMQIDKLADDITLSKSQEVHIKAILTHLPVRMIKTGCMEAYSIWYVCEVQFEVQQKYYTVV